MHKQTKNSSTLKQLQKDLQFTIIDDLLNYYLALEKTYICNAFTDGLNKEQANFVVLCEKETSIDKKILEGKIASETA